MQRVGILGLACALAFWGASVAQAVIVVDDFEVSNIALNISPGGATAQTGTENAAGPIGGSRQLDLLLTGGGAGTVLGARASVDAGHLGLLTFSNDATVTSMLTLLYDGNVALGDQQALNWDLQTASEFVFDIQSADLGFQAAIILCSGTTNSCITNIITSSALTNSVFTHPINSTTFAGLTPSFLLDIDSITIKFTAPTPDLDLVLRGITLSNEIPPASPVPEAATVLLMGTCLAGIGLVGLVRRRSRQA